MTLQEMLESAQLDALGMLEGEDLRAFEEAFASANPAIQAQVRAEQERCVRSAMNFSNAEPPAYLKERVLGAIQAEILADVAGTDASLTESGLGREIEATGVVGRVGAKKSPRVSPAWRASSLGFATAAAVLLAAFFSVSRQMDTLQERANNEGVLQQFSKAFGGETYDEALFGKSVSRFAFDAAPGVTNAGAATLFLLPDADEARLFVKDLATAANQTVRVVLLEADGSIKSELAEFAMNAKIGTAKLAHEVVKGQRLAIAIATIGTAATAADVRLIVKTA